MWRCHEDGNGDFARVLLRQVEILDITTGAVITGTLNIGKPTEDLDTKTMKYSSVIEFDGGGSVYLTDDEHCQLVDTAWFNQPCAQDDVAAQDEYLTTEHNVLAQLALDLEELARELDEVGLLL